MRTCSPRAYSRQPGVILTGFMGFMHLMLRHDNYTEKLVRMGFIQKSHVLEDAVVANAALLTRRLMRKYGIPIENVLRHYDVVSKRCPAMWVDDENAWFAFKRQVMEVMEMTKEELLSLKGTGDHPSDWALQAAQWAKENGIFTGDSAGNFGWQQPVTREAVAKLLYEYDQARNVDSGAADMVK